ncbi:MAG: MFS transporter [Sedimentisphaerales bacterium]|nr:MFS transporter [Sedimentisphaerales bacterium]
MQANNQKVGFRNVVILSVVSFLNDLSSEMIMPILPLFLASLGGSGRIIGLVGGLRDSLSSILKVFCGYLSDKTGKRKVFVYWGYGVSTVFKILLALSKSWPLAVVFASLERLGKGLRTAARDAIIAESVAATRRGKGFGIHRGFDSFGAILGSAVAFLLLWFAGFQLSTIILIAGVIGLASLPPLRLVKEPEIHKQDIKLKIGLPLLPKPLRLYILVAGIFALGNFSYMFFVLRAQHLFTGEWSKAAPILLYVLFNVFYSALAVPLGSLSDKIGRQPIIIFGFTMFAVVSFGFAVFDSLVAYVVLFALYGVVLAAIDGAERAFVSDLAGANLKATALGAYHTVTGLAALPASIVAGVLWEGVSPQAPFIFGGTAALLAVAVFLAFRRSFTRIGPA